MSRKLLILIVLFAPLVASCAEPAPQPGDVIKDCDDCPEMVVLPTGDFIMGSTSGHKRERPPHKVVISKPFAMARTEATFDQWQACIDAKACDRDPDDHAWGKGARPVINIDWDDAIQYTKWLSAKTGQSYRLASEAEWEYAARAGAETDFSWGPDVGVNQANCRRCGSEWSGIETSPAGSFPPNAFGIQDLPGNVWEWVQDCWRPDYTGATDTAEPYDPPECKLRITRGGAWYYIPAQARASARVKNSNRLWSYTIGFRVVRDLN